MLLCCVLTVDERSSRVERHGDLLPRLHEDQPIYLSFFSTFRFSFFFLRSVWTLVRSEKIVCSFNSLVKRQLPNALSLYYLYQETQTNVLETSNLFKNIRAIGRRKTCDRRTGCSPLCRDLQRGSAQGASYAQPSLFAEEERPRPSGGRQVART